MTYRLGLSVLASILVVFATLVPMTSQAMSFRMSDASPEELAEMATQFKGQKPITEAEVDKFFNTLAIADGKGDPKKPAFSEDDIGKMEENDRNAYLLFKIMLVIEIIDATDDPKKAASLKGKVPPSLFPSKKEIDIVKTRASAFMEADRLPNRKNSGEVDEKDAKF